ncbi:hypothetical protein Tco_1316356 [Tanacetum coccineum]
MTLLQGAPSIQGASLIRSSLPTKISIKPSSSPSTIESSPGLNGESFPSKPAIVPGIGTPPPYVFKKKSLIAMSVIMELQNGICIWLTTPAVEEDEAEEEAEGEVANTRASGSAEMYRNMSQGDWQETQANWMYDHTVREFQYLSTRDNLEPQLQIDPFPGREADYHPYGYHGHMPPGYAYRPGLSYDGSS